MLKNSKVNGFLGLARRAGKLCFGTEACIKEIESNKIKLVIIAEDAAERTKKKFKNLCSQKNIPICESLRIEEISKAIGQQNKAVVGIKDTNFSKEIIKIINGGEAIG